MSKGHAAPAPDAEREEFTALYERHHRALYRYCRSIVRHEHDAQDAMQSTMTRAYAALKSEPRDFDLRPWLFHIAHNESVSILRRRRPVVELDGELADAAAVDDRIQARETLRLLRQDLDDLPRRQRTALILRELYGLRPAEIAATLETTPGAVKQAILDARRALSKCDEGRATPCLEVQRALSDGDGRVMRARRLRAHLRSCASCRRFKADMGRRPAELAALAPTLPAGAGAALLAALHGSASAGAGAGALAGRLLAKVAIGAVVVTATAATGAHSLHHARQSSARPAGAARASKSRPSPHAVAATPRPREAVAQPPRAPAPARPAKSRARGTRTAMLPRRTPRTATGTPRPPAPAAPAQPAMGDAGAPRQARKPPEPAAPPGQAKEQTGAVAHPGQAKKQTGAAAGQARKQAGTATPAGQAKKHAGAATPPGPAKKQADPVTAPARPDPAGTPAPGPAPPPSAPGNSGNAPGQAPGGSHGASGVR